MKSSKNNILEEFKELFPDVSESDISREFENLKGLQSELKPSNEFKQSLKNKLEHLHSIQTDSHTNGFSWFQYAGVVFTCVFAFSMLYSLYDIQKTGFEPIKHSEKNEKLEIEIKGSDEFDATFEDILDTSRELFETEIMGIDESEVISAPANLPPPEPKKFQAMSEKNQETESPDSQENTPINTDPQNKNVDPQNKNVEPQNNPSMKVGNEESNTLDTPMSDPPSSQYMMQSDMMQDSPENQGEQMNESTMMMESRIMISDIPSETDKQLVCEENDGVVSDDGTYCSFQDNRVCSLEEIENCFE